MDHTSSALVGQPSRAQELIDAIKAMDYEWGPMDYSVSNVRVPDHRIHFLRREDAERLHKTMDRGGIGTVLNEWADPHPHIVVFSGITRVKKATRFLKNGKRTRKPTGKVARARAAARQRERDQKMGTSIATLPMSKTEARGLVKEILSDAKRLAAKLQELRDRLGWKALGYDSWAACVKAEFGYSKRWANQQIEAANVRERVGTVVPTESPDGGAIPERQTRELGRLPVDQQLACYKDFLDECKQQGTKPTAAGLREKVDSWLADSEPYVEEPVEDDHVVDGHVEHVADGQHGDDVQPGDEDQHADDQHDEDADELGDGQVDRGSGNVPAVAPGGGFDVDAESDRAIDWFRQTMRRFPEDQRKGLYDLLRQVAEQELPADDQPDHVGDRNGGYSQDDRDWYFAVRRVLELPAVPPPEYAAVLQEHPKVDREGAWAHYRELEAHTNYEGERALPSPAALRDVCEFRADNRVWEGGE